MISETHFFQFTSSWGNFSFEKSKKAIDVTLKKHVPLKNRFFRANQAPFINKDIK